MKLSLLCLACFISVAMTQKNPLSWQQGISPTAPYFVLVDPAAAMADVDDESDYDQDEMDVEQRMANGLQRLRGSFPSLQQYHHNENVNQYYGPLAYPHNNPLNPYEDRYYGSVSSRQKNRLRPLGLRRPSLIPSNNQRFLFGGFSNLFFPSAFYSYLSGLSTSIYSTTTTYFQFNSTVTTTLVTSCIPLNQFTTSNSMYSTNACRRKRNDVLEELLEVGNLEDDISQRMNYEEELITLTDEQGSQEVNEPLVASKLQLAMPNLKGKKAKRPNNIFRIEPEMLNAIDKVAETYTPKAREKKKKDLITKLEAVAVETEENKIAPLQREKLNSLLQSMNKSAIQRRSPVKDNRQINKNNEKESIKLENMDGQKEEDNLGGKHNVSIKGSVESFSANKEKTEHLNALLNTLTVEVKKETKNAPRTSNSAQNKRDTLYGSKPIGVFQNAKFDDSVVQLTTWDKLYQRELELAVTLPPANGFQQMIQWTRKGKMWHFPINNEQGMEEEEHIGFHEHVFLQPHLEPWCPRRGPVRHFMELVVVGLSKNPYMSLSTKLEHIQWFRDFFDQQRSILVETGAIAEETSAPTSQLT
nr:EOG090X04UC [Eurycercus lamellatus]